MIPQHWRAPQPTNTRNTAPILGFAISAIIAHQGGWDEGLLIAAPLLVIVGLLRLAKRRADKFDHSAEPDSQVNASTDE